MKAYFCLGASLLSAMILGAASGLAQDTARAKPLFTRPVDVKPLPFKPRPLPPPITNRAPVVHMVTPRDGTVLLAPVDLHICAVTAYFTNTVASVEFFAGTNSLGVVTNSAVGLGGSEWCRLPGAFFCLTWSNVPPGAYALTATAQDLAGNSATSAVVDISVVTNVPPRVSIVKPRDGATIVGPTNVNICASAFDPYNGTVTQVEFFAGTNSLGIVTNEPTIWITNRHGVFPVRNTSYCFTWTNAQPGAYALTAVASDSDGATTTSQPVEISVVTNLPPRVKLVSPWDGATYFAPAVVAICAAASDAGGAITGVEFFAGTNSLGVVTNSLAVPNHRGVCDLYCFTWGSVAEGTYAVTAVATDNDGAATTSAPVEIRVLPPPPPSVKITSPFNNAIFPAPANIWISSATRHFPNRVANVQYFAGTNSLAIVTNGAGFWYKWTNVPPGVYSLTATATDVSGTNTATSLPVQVTVRTNRPPLRPW